MMHIGAKWNNGWKVTQNTSKWLDIHPSAFAHLSNPLGFILWAKVRNGIFGKNVAYKSEMEHWLESESKLFEMYRYSSECIFSVFYSLKLHNGCNRKKWISGTIMMHIRAKKIIVSKVTQNPSKELRYERNRTLVGKWLKTHRNASTFILAHYRHILMQQSPFWAHKGEVEFWAESDAY